MLYEDEHMIAVNKPPDLLTAPKHRWMVRAVLLCARHLACFSMPALAGFFEQHTH